MIHSNTDFAALVGSRICHDLISPVGAIGNGLELIEMSGTTAGPELDLIADSVGNANARIRYFRIAFGHASAGQSVSDREIRSILSDVEAGARISYDWQVTGNVPRDELRAVFLAILCQETVLGHGGMITITQNHGTWILSSMGKKILFDKALWDDLKRLDKQVEITPARVQFGLLPHAIEALGKEILYNEENETFVVKF